MPELPITRIVLYKHGVGYFEREGTVEGEATLTLGFKQAEVSDVLKSLIALDLDGGHIATVSYDSTKPLEQLLAEVALEIPDQDSLAGLLPQLKGSRVSVRPAGAEVVEGTLLGLDRFRQFHDGEVVEASQLALLTDDGQVRSFDLRDLGALNLLDEGVRRDLDYYLRTQLSAKKKDARSFTILARGDGSRRLRLGYTIEAPVWKATYRILMGEEDHPPMIQGWAVVDNTQDEDWENIQLSLVAGLPVSFIHDLYTPRYIKRPEVAVQETTGVLPPEVEEGIAAHYMPEPATPALDEIIAASRVAGPARHWRAFPSMEITPEAMRRSTPAQVRERVLGDLFAYDIEHPVTIRRNQSALVPIVLREFQGRPVLLYNKQTRADNPMRCVEFRNTTGLTLEGGPVTVLEGGDYVGEAMLDTLKPDEERLVPFAVELGVFVLDNINSFDDPVFRVVIRKGQLKTHYGQVRQTTYTLRNKSDAEQTVYLDHPREDREWKLADTPEPHETTEHFWRFRFPLPPKKTTKFVVHQRRTLHQAHALADVSDRDLTYWISQRYLDRKTEKTLRQVFELRQQVATLGEQIERLKADRASIHDQQTRVRENLQALGDRASEKDLRERCVRGLNAQEDRLEQIEVELRDHIIQRSRILAQINELVATLEFETDLSA